VFFLATFALPLASIIIATARCRSDREYDTPPSNAPAVSLVRPVCGNACGCGREADRQRAQPRSSPCPGRAPKRKLDIDRAPKSSTRR
jgi:hypothetical protein